MQWRIEEYINNFLSQEQNAEIVSLEVVALSNTKNYGRCSKCNTWCSNQSLPDPVHEFSNGEQRNGVWFCDICTPSDSEISFYTLRSR